jgi:hypothetical protein
MNATIAAVINQRNLRNNVRTTRVREAEKTPLNVSVTTSQQHRRHKLKAAQSQLIATMSGSR